jgi:hypothetical protein
MRTKSPQQAVREAWQGLRAIENSVRNCAAFMVPQHAESLRKAQARYDAAKAAAARSAS